MIIVGIALTVVGGFLLQTAGNKLNPELHEVGWPLVIAGPGVVVFGIVLLRSEWSPRVRSARESPPPPSDDPYSPDDFPCPDPKPGADSENQALLCLLDSPIDNDELPFAVVVPQRSAGDRDLKELGTRLRDWKSANGLIRRIIGLEELLDGRLPQTPSAIFCLADRSDREPVALVTVSHAANNVSTGDSLIQVLQGYAVETVVSAAYYSAICG